MSEPPAARTDMVALQQRLQHEFNNPALLQQALTHRSHSAEHNERLEFLGDSVLNLAVAHLLFERMSHVPEGELSRMRSNLVRQESLHEQALKLGLPGLIRLGEGELRSGGTKRPSILADALEALSAAAGPAGIAGARLVANGGGGAEARRGRSAGHGRRGHRDQSGRPGESDGDAGRGGQTEQPIFDR